MRFACPGRDQGGRGGRVSARFIPAASLHQACATTVVSELTLPTEENCDPNREIQGVFREVDVAEASLELLA